MSESNVTQLPTDNLEPSPKQALLNYIESNLPENYSLNGDLIIHREWVQRGQANFPVDTEICSPLAITALTHSEDGKEGGLLLKWIDRRDNVREWVLPQSLLGEYKEISEQLQLNLVKYLPVEPKARRLFLDMLQRSMPDSWIMHTQRTGWHDDSFVFPDHVIGNKEIVFQSVNAKSKPPVITGDCSEWKNHIGKYCIGNPTLILGATTAFASPLAGLLGENGFICHLIGESSKGKTISLGVNCSVFGLEKNLWRSTDNSQESLYEARNHMGVAIDELGQSTPKDVYQSVYMLANGKGKARANKNGDALRVRTFNLIGLSTGEMGLNDFLSNGGKTITGGLSVRFIEGVSDQFNYGCFDDIHGMNDGGAFASYMESMTGITGDNYDPKYSGAVGIAFIKYLADNVGNNLEVRTALKARIKSIADSLTPQGSDSQIGRMARSIALLVVAGELATKAGLTGWDKNTAYKELARWWNECVIETRGGTQSTEKEKALEQVIDFFQLNHMSHFAQMGTTADNKPIAHYGNNYGYVEEVNGVTTFYVTSAGWKAICKGFNPRQVTQQMIDKGLLTPYKDGLSQTPKKINGKTIKCYAINQSILA